MLREILEKNNIKVYHGGPKSFKNIDPKYMFLDISNSQEGIGIYFAKDIEVAKKYGNVIMELFIDPKKFVPSRDLFIDHFNEDKIIKMLKMLYKIDKEEMYYLVSDYIEIYDSEDLNDEIIEDYANYFMDEEIRNGQITLAESFGTKNFVDVWNKVFPDIWGTEYENEIYIVINTKLRPKPIS